MSASTTLDRAETALRHHFGFDQFRAGQAEVISALLEGRSSLAIFPTGAGKSICYQLPGLLLDGVTLVVSPLIALMKDQLDYLRRKNIPAARLDSTLSLEEYRDTIAALNAGQLKLLYLAPERLANERLIHTLKRAKISLLAIDEAHCISEWGHNFRPDYMRLAALAQELHVERVLCLTATATPAVAGDIATAFQVADRDIIQTGFHRPNLELRVTPCPSTHAADLLIERLRERPPGATIVYVTLQKTADNVASRLTDHGFEAQSYHAGMKDDDRVLVQDWFMTQRVPIVVATIAFGMGIDRANIRYIYHVNLPKSLENYAQEIGRAGRDGEPAICELFAAGEDRIVLENFTYGDTPEPAAVTNLMRDVLSRGEIFEVSPYELAHTYDIRELVVKTLLTYLELEEVVRPTGAIFTEYKFQPLRPSSEILSRFDPERAKFLKEIFSRCVRGTTWMTVPVDRVAEEIGESRQRIISALSYLEDQGDLQLQMTGKRLGYRRLKIGAALKGLPERINTRFEQREARDIERLQMVLDYANRAECRTGVLTEYFDDPLPEPCGHCDVCLGATVSPIPDVGSRELEAHHLATMRKVASLGHPALASPRQLTRFLCGLSSPASTQAKLGRSADFGALRDVPFQLVLAASVSEIAR